MSKGSHSFFFFFPVCGPVCSLSIVLLECLWIFFRSSGAKFSVQPDDEASVADEELKVAWYLRQQRSGRLMLSSIQWTVMGCCQNDSLSGCHSELGSVKAQRVAAAAATTYYMIIKHSATEIVACVAKSKQILNYFVEQQSLLFSSLFFNTWSLWHGQEFVCHFFFRIYIIFDKPQRSEPLLKLPETQRATKPVSQFSAPASKV